MRMRADSASPRLRILVLARLFGGLKAGLAAGRWEPAGVPAIYRLLEGLGADPEIDLLTVFSLKEQDRRFPKTIRQRIEPIGETVTLPYQDWFGTRGRSLNTATTEFAHTARILALAARFRPHVIYATYASLHAAALLARAGHRSVVLRLMGIVPHHRRITDGAFPVFRWQLRAPFAHVVCTEDGSDPAAILPKLLRRETPWTVRLNGCDAPPASEQDVRSFRDEVGLGERPIVAFLGRLERQKGSMEFTDAAIAALAAAPNCADFVIVGDGPVRADMEQRVAAGGQQERIHFAGAQPHARANRYLAAADIYVSTNMYGNLSNANLEAVAAGSCIVLPTSDQSVPIDTVTDDLIPTNAALRYDRNRLPGSLADTLRYLLSSLDEVAQRRARTAALAEHLIVPWAERVKSDIELLKSISVSGRPIAGEPVDTDESAAGGRRDQLIDGHR